MKYFPAQIPPKKKRNTPFKKFRTASAVISTLYRAIPVLLATLAVLKVVAVVRSIKFSGGNILIDKKSKVKYVFGMRDITLVNTSAHKVYAGNMVTSNAPIGTAIAGNCVLAHGPVEKTMQGKKS